ncbi:MAG: hypothetical protein Q9183_006912, partial [Haloplaca sp. 2 TL-2023]
MADEKVLFNDLSTDPQLFEGEGELQYEVYRQMRDILEDEGDAWDAFRPRTNVLWLIHLLIMLLEKRPKTGKQKDEQELWDKLDRLKDSLSLSDGKAAFLSSQDVVRYCESGFADVVPKTMDPLLRLRQSIAANHPPVTTASSDPESISDATEDLALATYLHFENPQSSYALDTSTRFISSDKPVDLRSIWFAWQNKDVAIPEYLASTEQLNEELAKKDDTVKVQNLKFVERLDLITWLEGASDESEYIKGLESDASAARSAQ